MLFGNARERGRDLRAERTGAAQIHVHAGVGRRDLDIEWLVGDLDRFGDSPGGFDGAIEAGRQDRAGVDGHDMMRARGGKADLQKVVDAAPRVQHHAATARAMGVDDDLVDRRDQSCLRQRFDQKRALPQVIFGERPVLHGAAAALAEMLADRLRALMARPIDMHEMATVGMTGNGLDRHRLAGQRIGDVDGTGRRIRDAVAAMAEPRNGELLSHARLLAETPHCRRRRRWVRR